jgi:hypothetical protein
MVPVFVVPIDGEPFAIEFGVPALFIHQALPRAAPNTSKIMMIGNVRFICVVIWNYAGVAAATVAARELKMMRPSLEPSKSSHARSG